MRNSLLIFCLIFCFISTSIAQSSGQLDVSVSTSHAGGNYKPRNIVAIWIEKSDGAFVKTLLAYADKRKTHLNKWQASTNAAGSEYNTVDAVTGATRSSHATRTCSWNAMDYNGNSVPDGEYKLWLELTDKNSTGNYSTISFTKNDQAFHQTPANKSSFSNIDITWTPTTTSTAALPKQKQNYVYPNPVRKELKLSEEPTEIYFILNQLGEKVYTGIEQCIDVSSMKKGQYYILFSDKTQLTFVKN